MSGFEYYVIQRYDTINDSIFHMSNGMQGAYSKMLGVVRILFLVLFLMPLFRRAEFTEPVEVDDGEKKLLEEICQLLIRQ